MSDPLPSSDAKLLEHEADVEPGSSLDPADHSLINAASAAGSDATIASSSNGSAATNVAPSIPPAIVPHDTGLTLTLPSPERSESNGSSSSSSSAAAGTAAGAAAASASGMERKRKEGERDESELNSKLPATPLMNNGVNNITPTFVNTAASPSFIAPSVSTPSSLPPAMPLTLSVSAPAPIAAPTPPTSSTQKPARASVEESPDGKWSRFKKQLGSGAFKDVYLAIDTETGSEVAWNVVDMKKISHKDSLRIKHETELLKTLNHPHIIRILDVWEDSVNEKLVFITERSAYTLKQHINNLHPAKLKVIRKYCRQILTALNYLHGLKPPVIHRDLKCENIFVESTTGNAILGDFGLSIAKENATSLIGTPGFLAPELFCEQYTEAVDIWSFGMCVLEMATNSYPYVECNGVVSVLLKKGFQGVLPEGLNQIADASLREFILMCLQPVEKRPTAQQLLDQKVFDLSEPPPKKVTDAVSTPLAVLNSQNEINQANGGAVIAASSTTNSSLASNSSAAAASSSSTSSSAAVGSTVHASADMATTSSIIPQALNTSAPHIPEAKQNSPSHIPAIASSSPTIQGAKLGPGVNGDQSSSSASMLPPSAISNSTLTPADAAAQQSRKLKPAAPDNSAKLASIKRRADYLIPKAVVAKTNDPAIVSIFLYTRLKDDLTQLHQNMQDVSQNPDSSFSKQAEEPDDLSKLLLIDIPAYDFNKDNYLAVATRLVKIREELGALSSSGSGGVELENIEEIIAAKIEEAVREKYEKFTAKARTESHSTIMTLLTSLGMNLTYAARFEEQEVSYEDLFLLSDEDLKEFIPKLGPRRRLQQYLTEEKAKQKQIALLQAAQQQQQLENSYGNLTAEEKEKLEKKRKLKEKEKEKERARRKAAAAGVESSSASLLPPPAIPSASPSNGSSSSDVVKKKKPSTNGSAETSNNEERKKAKKPPVVPTNPEVDPLGTHQIVMPSTSIHTAVSNLSVNTSSSIALPPPSSTTSSSSSPKPSSAVPSPAASPAPAPTSARTVSAGGALAPAPSSATASPSSRSGSTVPSGAVTPNPTAGSGTPKLPKNAAESKSANGDVQMNALLNKISFELTPVKNPLATPNSPSVDPLPQLGNRSSFSTPGGSAAGSAAASGASTSPTRTRRNSGSTLQQMASARNSSNLNLNAAVPSTVHPTVGSILSAVPPHAAMANAATHVISPFAINLAPHQQQSHSPLFAAVPKQPTTTR